MNMDTLKVQTKQPCILSKNDALYAVIEAINDNDLYRANMIMKIVSRSIKEDGIHKLFTNRVKLIDSQEIMLFSSSTSRSSRTKPSVLSQKNKLEQSISKTEGPN